MTYINFNVDRKHDCVSFQNGYWFPISDFTHQHEDGVYHGLNHLMKKRWFTDNILNELLVFLKSEFPNIDFSETVTRTKEHEKKMSDFFNSLKCKTNV